MYKTLRTSLDHIRRGNDMPRETWLIFLFLSKAVRGNDNSCKKADS